MIPGPEERRPRAGRHASLIVIAAALLTGAPLLFGRILAGHDTRTYLAYAASFAAQLREGILLPAWAPELNGGYGGPGLFLYPPLVHVFHALALLAGVRAGFAVGLLALAGLALSGVACHAWLRSEGAGVAEEGALAGALVYMLAPYRLVDLYERTALSEHWAFVFPPLILLALHARRPRRLALAALAFAGLALTNLPMLVLFGGALVVVAASRGLSALADLLAAGALGAGIAAFVLVPAALASRWTVTELFYGGRAAGFRPSENTLFSGRALLPDFNRGVSLALLATAALAALALALGRRTRADLAWGGIAAAALLSALPFAGGLWDAVPIVSKLQFPWRATAPLTLALAALAGTLRTRTRAGTVLLLTVLSGAPLLGRMTAPPAVLGREPAVTAPAGTEFPDPAEVRAAEGDAKTPWLASPHLADVWYLPRTLGPALADEIYRGGPPAVPALAHAPAAAPGNVKTLRVVSWKRADREIEVTADAPGLLVLHALAFPGMRVHVDGAPVSAGREARTGLLALQVPAGIHRVAWGWRPVAELRVARYLSAAALLLTIALLAFPRREAPTP